MVKRLGLDHQWTESSQIHYQVTDEVFARQQDLFTDLYSGRRRSARCRRGWVVRTF